VEALRAQSSLQPPRLPPQLVQQPAALPQQHKARDTIDQEAARY
jgi:hypothetical protein